MYGCYMNLSGRACVCVFIASNTEVNILQFTIIDATWRRLLFFGQSWKSNKKHTNDLVKL